MQFARRKEQAALAAALAPYVTALDEHDPEAMAFGNAWSRSLFDGHFYVSPPPDQSQPAGNLVFVPDSRGVIHAYDAETGTELWNHSDGTGHQGGIVSYAVGGKQYIAVTAGFGGMASDDYAPTFGGVYKSMPRDDGALIVYSLK